VVDAADYVVWRKNPGPGETYSDWWQNFAESQGGGAFSDESVPEPSAAVFVVIGCAAWSTRRRIFAQ
jgi:hypothetical protein